MPEYRAPGVFVEEVERGPKPIEGVSTTTTAFLGETERGPTKPLLVTSYDEFRQIFGGVYKTGNCLPHAVKLFFENGGQRLYIARVVGESSAHAELKIGKFHLSSVAPGAAYNRIWARILPSSTGDDGGEAVGFRLQLAYWEGEPYDETEFSDPFDESNAERLPKPSLIEDFDDLSLDATSPAYWDRRVNQKGSVLIKIVVDSDTTIDDVLLTGVASSLANGADGDPPEVEHFRGNHIAIENRAGLAALDQCGDIAVIAVPGYTSRDIQTAVISHCEAIRFRFAVLDGPQYQPNAAALDPRSDIAASDLAAYYFPWLIVSDALTGALVNVPPSGAVCGIYARADMARGVWKAPANATLSGVLDLKYQINNSEQEVLTPRGVNSIRRFSGRGIRVWGARTLSNDPEWRYINVRRILIYLEASIFYSTQWIVFEPNDQQLWERVKQLVSAFLRNQWREGALAGRKEEEAFYVAVGLNTMTEDDIRNGNLIVEIGIAPVRPAEFMILRIRQKTMESQD